MTTSRLASLLYYGMSGPYDFTGVTRGAHVAALRAFYTATNPEKLSLLDAMYEKFGPGVWASLKAKYPDVRPNAVAVAVWGDCGVQPLDRA